MQGQVILRQIMTCKNSRTVLLRRVQANHLHQKRPTRDIDSAVETQLSPTYNANVGPTSSAHQVQHNHVLAKHQTC
eukprot:12174530-Prorocentrum_lima.AAC.1